MTCLRPAVVGSAILSITVVLSSTSAQAPRDGRPNPVPRVSGMEELAPSNAIEREAARIFDTLGPKIQPGVTPAFVFREAIPPPPDSAYVPSRTDLLRHDVCRSLVVVLASVVRSRVILNASGSGLVTVYYLDVKRWLYSAIGTPVLVAALVGGRVFVADTEYFSQPEMPWWEDVRVGPTYLMHLGASGATPSIYYFARQVSVSVEDRLSVGTVSGPTAQILDEIEAVGKSCGTKR